MIPATPTAWPTFSAEAALEGVADPEDPAAPEEAEAEPDSEAEAEADSEADPEALDISTNPLSGFLVG
jgi:hypothetical protein